MKLLIKKLNPLHPILPALCLLIALFWVGYDSFFKEKYTEEEKVHFQDAIGRIEILSYKYQDDAEKLLNIDWYFGREYCIEENYQDTRKKAKQLKHINSNLTAENFNKIDFTKEISICSIFESYIKEAKKLDVLLAEKYDNFELENGLSEKEINLKYFSHDSLQSKYHLARFKVEFAKMYYEDVELLLNKRIKKVFKERIYGTVALPYIISQTGKIYLNYSYNFDTVYTKIISPKKLETQFNENGHLIIPRSIRNSGSVIKININCSTDTTYTLKMKYYEN